MVTRAFVLAATVVLFAAACGSSRQGSIERPVAERLAAQSDAVAAKLRAGDGCGAAALARTLRRDVVAAGLPLAARTAAAGLASEIVCVPPAPVQQQPAPVVEGHGKGHGKGHEKHHGNHGGDNGD